MSSSSTYLRSGEHPMSEFAECRARAERELDDQRDRAVRMVVRHSRDQEECTGLLSMLGLDPGIQRTGR